ncbi:MAG: BatA domain-containing protein, partial [candidate division Zixibacteria bacterium]|nr:BatA domain-containing protein [candidate division Zixibacteria bacterium]
MLGFLNSTILLAAAAALIPLIIHLFSRRRVKIVPFSSLRHLKAMQRRQVRRLRIRQLLLLIVRMLIILTVVLAFARPTVETGGVGSHAAVSAAIVLDNSASMNRYVADGNLFQLAHLRTSELIETFGEADQIQLLPLDHTGFSVDAFSPGSPASVLEQLQNIHAGSDLADLEGGLENADQFLSDASNLNREIYIVS